MMTLYKRVQVNLVILVMMRLRIAPSVSSIVMGKSQLMGVRVMKKKKVRLVIMMKRRKVTVRRVSRKFLSLPPKGLSDLAPGDVLTIQVVG